MKRILSAALAVALLLGTALLCSCELNVFGSSPDYVKYTEGVLENERYILWDGHIVDKQEGKIYQLQYPTGEKNYYNSLYENRYEIDGEEIRQFAYIQSAKYDPDTGAVSHYVYYRTELAFDLYGTMLRQTTAEEALSEEEFRAECEASPTEDGIFSFSQIQGSGRHDHGEEAVEGVYTEAQQKVVDYALGLEKKLLGEFHYTCGIGKEIDGRIWFTVERYNQKDWGQGPVNQGLYSSTVVCYDPLTDSFEQKLELTDNEQILAFNDTYVIVDDNWEIESISYESGKRREIMKIEGEKYYYRFETAGDVLHVYRSETIRGKSPEKTMTFTRPCDLHWFIRLDGDVICEDYDISREEKEQLETAVDVEYQGW